MRLQITLSCTILLVVTAFGRFINNQQVASVSDSHLESKVLNNTVAKDGLLDESPAAGPEAINSGSEPQFDPTVWASNQLWSRYVSKGNQLLCLMQASDQVAGNLLQDTRQPPSAASKWSGDLTAALRLWGWYDTETPQGEECNFEWEGLEDAFEGLGLNYGPMFDERNEAAGGENECFSIEHWNRDLTLPEDPDLDPIPIVEQRYYVNGREYRETGATYLFAINLEGGAIIGKNILSPRAAARYSYSWGHEARPEELPELQHLSDIYWQFWRENNRDITNLRVYGAEHVINEHTLLLVTRGFRNRGKFALEIWPGVRFEMGSEEYLALIASPIGGTISHFLISHKAGLGIKRISSVIVVCGGDNQELCTRGQENMHIFFTIEDVPHTQATKREEDKGGNGETNWVKSHVLHVRDDGKQIIREHKIMANL